MGFRLFLVLGFFNLMSLLFFVLNDDEIDKFEILKFVYFLSISLINLLGSQSFIFPHLYLVLANDIVNFFFALVMAT